MPLDLDASPPTVKLQQIKLGEQFGSRDTLDQANQTLKAYGKLGAKLASQGFMKADAQRLTDARDLLVEAGVGREEAKGDKKTTSAAYTAAMTKGQIARLSARSILEAVRSDLDEQGEEALAATVTASLRQTTPTGEDAVHLSQQLDVLRSRLGAPELSTHVTARDGNGAAPQLADAAKALRAADQADTGVRGTPAETQRLDQLDGIIVRLVRRARHAAVAAAKALGDPALAEAFKLEKLYQSRGGKAADEEESTDDEPQAEDASAVAKTGTEAQGGGKSGEATPSAATPSAATPSAAKPSAAKPSTPEAGGGAAEGGEA